MSPSLPLVLASTSTYRQALLARLGLGFETARPDVDEFPLEGEHPGAMAQRLARAKALSVAQHHPGRWVIGSDQAADLDGRSIGKPGTIPAAHAQLTAMSGRCVNFHTALCLTDGTRLLEANDLTRVHFRQLTADEIQRYITVEHPLDCAGSFKCEGLGIALFDSIENNDPTALVGLPLIITCQLLREAGFQVP